MDEVERLYLPETPERVSNDSPLFQALEVAGLVGCINTDEQLSTTYKSRLDFSDKCGTHPTEPD